MPSGKRPTFINVDREEVLKEAKKIHVQSLTGREWNRLSATLKREYVNEATKRLIRRNFP
jgi:hypothetical protein